LKEFDPMQEPLFIIAPGRSYTSLIGGMIGQHPDVYGLPEVNLSVADTLGEWLGALAGPLELTRAGLLRLLAHLHEGEQTEEAVLRARQWAMQRGHWSTRAVFDHIQEQVGDRLLVEKSPLNTLRPEHLQRLLRIFPRASFLHLTRNPHTAGKSSFELRKSLREGKFEGFSNQRTSNLDPEMLWLKSQTNIMDFASGLALGQYMRIKAEVLLRDPQTYLAQICEWLGLSTDADSIAAMLHPENSPFASVGPPTARFGNDPNFLKNPKIDFSRLAKISEPDIEGEISWRPGERFGAPVLKLARQFGYG
jgi:hypothetical protein